MTNREISYLLSARDEASRTFSDVASNAQRSAAVAKKSFDEMNKSGQDFSRTMRQQAAPSMTAFTQIIQDSSQFSMGWQQGLRAIGNNIEYFTQQTGNAINRGMSFKQLMQGMAASLLGANGVLFAVSAITTGIQLLAQAFKDDLPDSVDASTAALDEFMQRFSDASVETLQKAKAAAEESNKKTDAELKKLRSAHAVTTEAMGMDWDVVQGKRAAAFNPEALKAEQDRLEQLKEDNDAIIEKLDEQIETQTRLNNLMAQYGAVIPKTKEEIAKAAAEARKAAKEAKEAIEAQRKSLDTEAKFYADRSAAINKNIAEYAQLMKLGVESGLVSKDLALKELEKAKAAAETAKNMKEVYAIQKMINDIKDDDVKDAKKKAEEASKLKSEIALMSLKTEKEREFEIIKQWEEKSIKLAQDNQDLITQIRKAASARRTEIEQKDTQKVFASTLRYAQQAIATLFAFQAQHHQAEIIAIQNERDERLGAIDAALENESLSAEERKRLEDERKKAAAEFRAQESAARQKAFEAEKAGAIISATIQTALAFAEALPNIPLALFVGALGAAQVALIASQPTPKFHDGGGGYFDAPPNHERQITIRGGESFNVQTPEQQAKGSGGSGGAIIIKHMQLNFNGATMREEVVKALTETVRLTGLTVEQLTVSNKDRIVMAD